MCIRDSRQVHDRPPLTPAPDRVPREGTTFARVLSSCTSENGYAQRRRVSGREGRLPRTFQLVALVP
eukprot:7343111-Alexandrium_andersonii.AAC.1